MITLDELKKQKTLLGLNLGQTEKNYIHTAILFAISKLFPEKLIFKGGTCLMICYNLDRFSEDLDFNLVEDINLDLLLSKIILFLKKYDIIIEYKIIKKGKYKDCFVYFYGPLYKGTNNTRCKVKLDFSERKDNVLEPSIIKVNHLYNELPTFYLKTLDINEIFSEKIRTIIGRNKARDLYDFNYLINRNIKVDVNLINKKLSIYNKIFSLDEFINGLNNKKEIWDREMKNLLNVYPSFEEVSKDVLEYIKKNIK